MLRIKKHHILSILCVFLLVSLLTVSVAACHKNNTSKDYYLSLQSENWQTFDSKEKIPQRLLFHSEGNDIYTLSVTLAQGEQFFLRNVGNDVKIGFDNVFSAETHLARGDGGSVKVAHGGTYVFSYDQAENILEYAYTAQRLSLEITTKVPVLHVGDKYTYKAAVNYSDGTRAQETPVWASSDSSVLTVNAAGEVQAVAVGNATLTATIGELNDSLDISVEQSNVEVSGVQLSQQELSLELGEEQQLTATVLPQDASSRLVSWSVDDDSVVTVNQLGVVTAVGYGKATVTVSTAQGGYTDQCVVIVVRHVESLRFSEDSITVVAEAVARQVSLVFSPVDATNMAYTLSVTGGSEFVLVDDDGSGVMTVTGIAAGTATLTAICADDPSISATCTVNVLDEGAVLADMQSNAQVFIGTPMDLEVSLVNAEPSRIVWSVANSDVATVSDNGNIARVTGVNFGSTVVTATVYDIDGNSYTAECDVLVLDEYFFIYGYGLGNSDWDWSFTTDREGAAQAEVLMQEEQRGIYTLTRYLTPDNGFQIIFPRVANFTQHDDTTDEDVWNKNIPSQWVESNYYYNAARSDNGYISNAADHLCVNSPGVYKITLDLTGSKAQVYINLVSLDVQSVEISLAQGDYVLRNGSSATFVFAVSPANAQFAESEVSVALHSDFADIVSYDFDFARKSISLLVNGSASRSFTATLTITVKGVSASVEVYILADNEPKNPVTSVTFEQTKYEFNVNNGLGNWTTTVKAVTNSNATNNQVRYYDVTDYNAVISHPANQRAIVNEYTGEVTARSLGTLKIKAVAADDPSVSATVEVLFYSDGIYIVGQGYGGWEALSQDTTSLEGSSKAQYGFTKADGSNSLYTYIYTPTGVDLTNGKMKIVFLGINEQWTGEINAANLVEELSNIYFGWHGSAGGGTGDVAFAENSNIRFLQLGTFKLTIDLSRHMPLLIIDRVDEERDIADAYILDYTGNNDLRRGDVVSAQLVTVPNKQYGSGEVIVSLSGNDDYLSYEYDASANLLTFTVDNVAHKDDKIVTVSITADGQTATLTFNIIAEHHLELTWDATDHWYRCTDEGCSYIEDSNGVADKKTSHQQQDSWTANAEGHYFACSGCGAEFGMQPHVYQLNDGVFDFSESMQECSVCQFRLFEIDGNTLKSYYGNVAETVKVPDSVTVIGDHAFEGHSEIVSLTYSSRATKIGNYAFAGCSSLQEIKIQNRISSIGQFAFKDCPVKITWGTNPLITEIGDNAFNGWLGSEFTIPSKVTTLGQWAFMNSNLKEIVVPDSVIYWSKYSTFENCKQLKHVDLGSGINTIPPLSFMNCSQLETVIVRGSTFWTIGVDSFTSCDSLRGFYIERDASNFAGTHPTVGSSWTQVNGASVLKGKVYFYTADESALSASYSQYEGFFAGFWHWDDSGNKELGNIVIWSGGNSTASANVLASLPAILNDKKNLFD